MSDRGTEHLKRQVGALRQKVKDLRAALNEAVDRIERLEAERWQGGSGSKSSG